MLPVKGSRSELSGCIGSSRSFKEAVGEGLVSIRLVLHLAQDTYGHQDQSSHSL